MWGEIETKNCFVFMSKVPFITHRFWPNLQCLQRMGRDLQMWCFAYPAWMRGELETKSCFMFTSKVPFITDRFRRYFQWLHCKYRVFEIWRFGHPAWMPGEIETKTFLCSQVKCPSLPTDFDETFVGCSACAGTSKCDVSFTPLVC
jgi:hypothetical protein